jgi:hypothetical protein
VIAVELPEAATYAQWRDKARELVLARVAPERVAACSLKMRPRRAAAWFMRRALLWR